MNYRKRSEWMGSNGGRIVDPWDSNTSPADPVSTLRQMNVPTDNSTSPYMSGTELHGRDQSVQEKLMDMLGALDDRVQGAARNAYGATANALGDRMGYDTRDTINTIGQFVHGDRRVYDQSRMGTAELLASRGLQAGGITAAGAQLIGLTEAFGGGGDEPKPGTLYM